MNEVGKLSPLQRDSLIVAIAEMFSVEELMEADKLQDSLFGQSERRALLIPSDRIKNSLLIKPIKEMPGASIYMPLPDDWKNIDPFASQSMIPKLPKHYAAPVPDYARFSVGMDGYYFAFKEMGYFGYGWTTLDSLRAQPEINFVLPEEKGRWSPNLLKALKLSNDALIILAVILQALLL